MLKNIVKTVKVLLVVLGIEAACFNTAKMLEESNSENKHTVGVVCGFLIGTMGASIIKKIIRK